MIKKVALFDFDNTVASGNTITRLLQYDIRKHPWHCIFLIQMAFYYGLYLIHLSSFEKAKSALLFPVRYMSDQEFEDFYHQHVVILCTASSEVYMKYNQLPIDQLIGTRTRRIGNHETSEIIGKNCKGKEKINRIKEYLKNQDIEIDYENSYGYSDSNDDIPMLSLVKHKKRVLLKTGEMIEFKE